jgi:hypothetical protein
VVAVAGVVDWLLVSEDAVEEGEKGTKSRGGGGSRTTKGERRSSILPCSAFPAQSTPTTMSAAI